MNYYSVVSPKKTIFADIIFVILIYLIPVFSHTLSFPLYLLDPMRWCVLGSYLLLRNKHNALLLAFSLPLFSYAISGHPILYKNAIISVELMANIIILDLFLRRYDKIFLPAFLSILASKLIYYSLKAIIIYFGLLSANIIDSSLLIQIIVAVLISLLFTKYYRK